MQADRPEAALVELTAAEREDPHDARIHNFRGIVLARLRQNGEAVGEYEEAIRLYEEALGKVVDGRWAICNQLGRLHKYRGSLFGSGTLV